MIEPFGAMRLKIRSKIKSEFYSQIKEEANVSVLLLKKNADVTHGDSVISSPGEKWSKVGGFVCHECAFYSLAPRNIRETPDGVSLTRFHRRFRHHFNNFRRIVTALISYNSDRVHGMPLRDTQGRWIPNGLLSRVYRFLAAVIVIDVTTRNSVLLLMSTRNGIDGKGVEY